MSSISIWVRFATFAALCLVVSTACNSSSPVEVSSEAGKPTKLYVSPVSVDFGSSGTSASVVLTNTSGRALSWSASESAGWLSLGTSSGTVWGNAASTLSLSAQRGSLAPGKYTTSIKVSGDKGAGSATVSVSLTVPSTGGTTEGQLAVSPLSVDFGTEQTTKSITLTNTGDASLSWTANESAGWLSLGATSGSVPANSSRTLTLAVDRTSMPTGTHTTSLGISAGTAGSVTGSVSMTVGSWSPPPSSVALAGKVVDQFGGQPLPGLKVTYAGVTATTDATGSFSIPGSPTTSLSALTVTGTGYYRRETYAKTGDSVWQVVPTTFNMSAFDDVARDEHASYTLRWLAAPTIYVDTTPEGFEAGPELDKWISQVQVQAAAFVTEWSGQTIHPSSVVVTSRPPQDNTGGTIVIHFSESASDYNNGDYIGMTRMSWSTSGAMSSAAIWLRYKRYSGDGYAGKRQGILGHELGHAMGYGHMTSGITSFMEPSLGSKTGLSAFDRQAALLIYTRAPRNMSHDIDSSTGYRALVPSGMPMVTEWVCAAGGK